jgi:hypothetical protein
LVQLVLDLVMMPSLPFVIRSSDESLTQLLSSYGSRNCIAN